MSIPPSRVHIINPIANAITVFVTAYDLIDSVWVSSFDEFTGSFPAAPTSDVDAISAYFSNGGQHLVIVGVGGDAMAALGDIHGKISQIQRFDLLAVSRVFQPFSVALFSELSSICDRREAVFLLDVDVPPVPSEALGWIAANQCVKQKHVALYFPALRVPDAERTVGASLAVAGLLNRIDRSQGPWVNPSGGVAQLQGGWTPERVLSNPETIQLNNVGINCVRTFKSLGTVVWGSASAVGLDHPNPYWKYIHVRRTLFYIKHSIEDALKPLKNIPFDADLEHDILSVLEPFLLELTSRGAFVVQNGGPGYSVDIGSIDGAIKVSVGLALIKPDELVGLTVTI